MVPEAGLQKIKYKGREMVATVPQNEAERLVDHLDRQAFRVVSVFKDDRRTYIARIEIDGCDCMYKIPRGRNRRPWERILTRLRDGEAFRHFRSMEELRELGLSGPEPVLAIQQRVGGMVVDGCLLYRYVEGERADGRHAALITPRLLQLHGLGYLRRDAHAKNYLLRGNEVVFIDFRLHRPWFFRRLRTRIELSKYLRTMPDGWDYVPDTLRTSWGMRLACRLDRMITGIKRGRRRLKAAVSGDPEGR
ncbi:MAG: hypothetical protein EA347_00170 [Thioalkalivibrio sp.]|nr:MAG: hypothetical protein EA347_00170 [Thioalkalivibrio sp.]